MAGITQLCRETDSPVLELSQGKVISTHLTRQRINMSSMRGLEPPLCSGQKEKLPLPPEVPLTNRFQDLVWEREEDVEAWNQKGVIILKRSN